MLWWPSMLFRWKNQPSLNICYPVFPISSFRNRFSSGQYKSRGKKSDKNAIKNVQSHLKCRIVKVDEISLSFSFSYNEWFANSSAGLVFFPAPNLHTPSSLIHFVLLAIKRSGNNKKRHGRKSGGGECFEKEAIIRGLLWQSYELLGPALSFFYTCFAFL